MRSIASAALVSAMPVFLATHGRHMGTRAISSTINGESRSLPPRIGLAMRHSRADWAINALEWSVRTLSLTRDLLARATSRSKSAKQADNSVTEPSARRRLLGYACPHGRVKRVGRY